MAIDIENTELYFIHIPKTAGSSITLWLQNNFSTTRLAKKHSPASEIHLANAKQSFTVVRNPFERVHSYYYFKIQRAQRFFKKTKHNTADAKWAAIGENTTFDSWIKDYFYKKNQKEIMSLRLIDYLDNNTRHILTQENLKTEFKVIQEQLNCSADLPLHNITNNRREYRSDYTNESRKIVEEFYKQDLEYFGYDF